MLSPIKIAMTLLSLATLSLSAPTPAPATPAAPASGKRGLAYLDAKLCKQFTSSAVTWGYDWNQLVASHVSDTKFEYVPMLWGEKMFGTWHKNIQGTIAQGGGKYILSFNEPDLPSQSSMSPSTAAQHYRDYMNPYGSTSQLGAPAVSNSGSPGQGLDWLKQFLTACGGSCKIDFVPIHWYDVTAGVDYFKKYIKSAYDVTGKPIWLTEFGVPGGSQEQQAAFMKQVLPWLDEQPYVHRYSYYGVFEGNMIQGGQLSQIGMTFDGKA